MRLYFLILYSCYILASVLMETASQTLVTSDNLPEKFQDMQVEIKTGARPKEMAQRREGLKRSVVYPTKLVGSRSSKAEENPRSNIQSLSNQRQQPSTSLDSPSTGKT